MEFTFFQKPGDRGLRKRCHIYSHCQTRSNTDSITENVVYLYATETKGSSMAILLTGGTSPAEKSICSAGHGFGNEKISCVTGRVLLAFFEIDLIKVYNVLPCHAAHLPTVKRATLFVVAVFVTVKNRPTL